MDKFMYVKGLHVKCRAKTTVLDLCGLLCFGMFAVIAGCKDLSPPPVNPYPQDELDVHFNIVTGGTIEDYRVEIAAEYGNLSLGCSNVDWLHSLGGKIDYPEKTINIESGHGKFTLYRDYFKIEGECAWRLLGVSIALYDSNGRNAGIGIPGNFMKDGYSQIYQCEFLDFPVNVCLPAENRHSRPGPRIRVMARRISK